MIITQTQIKKLFDYDSVTGNLIRRIDIGKRVKVGDIAGSIDIRGYLQVGISRKTYLIHRLIYLYHHGYFPKEIDHINRNKLDNRIENLREVTRQENSVNAGNRKNNTSGIKGVIWYKRLQKWYARIYINGKRKHLGYYRNFDDAVLARLKAEQELGWDKINDNSPAYQYIQENQLI